MKERHYSYQNHNGIDLEKNNGLKLTSLVNSTEFRQMFPETRSLGTVS